MLIVSTSNSDETIRRPCPLVFVRPQATTARRQDDEIRDLKRRLDSTEKENQWMAAEVGRLRMLRQAPSPDGRPAQRPRSSSSAGAQCVANEPLRCMSNLITRRHIAPDHTG